MEKRKCKICGKSLSTYNKENICFCHKPGRKVKKVPITKCTSYFPNEDPLRRSPFKLRPGDNGYNERAFTEIDEDIIEEDS